MKFILGGLFLMLGSAMAAAQEPPPLPVEDFKDLRIECVSAANGAQLLGRQGCVAGRVYSASVAKNGNQHLSLCAPRSGCSFHVVVPRHDRHQVGDITYLRGKVVAFSGEVTLFRNKPRLVIHAREQIHVTAGSTPSEFDAAQPKPSHKGIPREKGSFTH